MAGGDTSRKQGINLIGLIALHAIDRDDLACGFGGRLRRGERCADCRERLAAHVEEERDHDGAGHEP